MELQYLCEFTVVAEKLNFSVAADALYLSQATLSKHIAALERDLDVKLFNRSTRSVALTSAGELLLPAAKEISRIYTTFESELQKRKAQKEASVSLVSIPILAPYHILDRIYPFQQSNPDVSLKITEQEALTITKTFETSDYQIAILRFFDNVPPQYHYIELCEDSIVAVMRADHPLSALPSIPLYAFQGETFLLLDRNTAIDQVCISLLEDTGILPKVNYQGHRPENLISLASAGVGISLMMRNHAEFFKTEQVVIRSITPTKKSKICMIWKKGAGLSPAAQAFIQYVSQVYSSKG